MNKTCARCEKTVYPTEELKCLDKVWHKGCFKCQECGMTLNMKTYKGYGKLPYCEAHVPKAKPTTMAETPELKRIAENTKIQSNVNYHAAFEKSKGKFTQVADDPETLRIKANTKIISNVAYHGELEKKAQMEKQRQINENGEIVELPAPDNYHQQIDNYATEMLPSTLPPPNLPPKNHYQTPMTQYQGAHQQTTHQPAHQQTAHQPTAHQPAHHPAHQQAHQQIAQHAAHKYQEQYYKPKEDYQYQYQDYQGQYYGQYPTQNYQMTHQAPHQVPHQAPHQVSHQAPHQVSHQAPHQVSHQAPHQVSHQAHHQVSHQVPHQVSHQVPPQMPQMPQPKIGRIEDYDPISDGPRAVPNTQRASATLIYNSTSDGKRGAQQSQQQTSRQIGRVTDLDPLANEMPRHAPNHQNQRVYIAMYDYEASDSDEVSFREGDLISNVTSIDEGWMTGQVLRTGRTGMLPANYVELAPSNVAQHY